jgi:predicted kinase
MDEHILIIIRGLPGSGKSTLAKILTNQHVEADMFFVKDGEYLFDGSKLKQAHEWCQKTTEALMLSNKMQEKKEIIVVSNTFTQAWEMEPYFNLAEKHGYKVFSLIAENRHGSENQHNVSHDVIEKMKNRFEISL